MVHDTAGNVYEALPSRRRAFLSFSFAAAAVIAAAAAAAGVSGCVPGLRFSETRASR